MEQDFKPLVREAMFDYIMDIDIENLTIHEVIEEAIGAELESYSTEYIDRKLSEMFDYVYDEVMPEIRKTVMRALQNKLEDI